MGSHERYVKFTWIFSTGFVIHFMSVCQRSFASSLKIVMSKCVIPLNHWSTHLATGSSEIVESVSASFEIKVKSLFFKVCTYRWWTRSHSSRTGSRSFYIHRADTVRIPRCSTPAGRTRCAHPGRSCPEALEYIYHSMVQRRTGIPFSACRWCHRSTGPSCRSRAHFRSRTPHPPRRFRCRSFSETRPGGGENSWRTQFVIVV